MVRKRKKPRVRLDITISEDAMRLLERLANYHGISRSATIEVLIRKSGRKIFRVGEDLHAQ